MQIYPVVKGVKVIKQAGGESGLRIGRRMKRRFKHFIYCISGWKPWEYGIVAKTLRLTNLVFSPAGNRKYIES